MSDWTPFVAFVPIFLSVVWLVWWTFRKDEKERQQLLDRVAKRCETEDGRLAKQRAYDAREAEWTAKVERDRAIMRGELPDDEKWRMRHNIGQPDALADQRWQQAWDLINEILRRRGWPLLSEGNVKSYNLGLIADAVAKLDGLASLRSVGGIETIEYRGQIDNEKARRLAEIAKAQEPSDRQTTEWFEVMDWCPEHYQTPYVAFRLGELPDIVMTHAHAEEFAETLLKQVHKQANQRQENHDRRVKAREAAKSEQHIDQDRLMGRPYGSQGDQGSGGKYAAPGALGKPEWITKQDDRGQYYAWPARLNLSPEEGAAGPGPK